MAEKTNASGLTWQCEGAEYREMLSSIQHAHWTVLDPFQIFLKSLVWIRMFRGPDL